MTTPLRYDTAPERSSWMYALPPLVDAGLSYYYSAPGKELPATLHGLGRGLLASGGYLLGRKVVDTPMGHIVGGLTGSLGASHLYKKLYPREDLYKKSALGQAVADSVLPRNLQGDPAQDAKTIDNNNVTSAQAIATKVQNLPNKQIANIPNNSRKIPNLSSETPLKEYNGMPIMKAGSVVLPKKYYVD